MSDQGLALVCALAIEPHEERQIAGTVRQRCSECGRDVWVAPSGMEILRSREDAFVVCHECGLAAIEADPDPDIRPPTVEQRDELARHREHNL